MKLRYKITGGILLVLALAVAIFALVLSYTAPCEPGPVLNENTETMGAVRYRCYGPPEVLALEDVAKPVPGDNEVLVRVHAAAVNPLDWHYMRGSPYFLRLGSGIGKPEDPRLGVDFAGTVETIGREVTRFRPGDEVFGAWSGAFGEYLVMPEARGLALKPGNISFEQAASVAVAAVTALQALRDKGNIKSGQKVLINGASGGVGTFAVQIAKSFGAEVSGVCSTRNVEMVRSIGADHVFDYTKEDYTRSGQQFDLIVDNVGNHSLSANRRVMTPGSTLVIVGGPKGDWFGPLMRPFGAMLLSRFVDQTLLFFIAQIRQEDLNMLADLMQAGEVTPVIDRTYELSEVPAAIAYSEEGHARGKIIIRIE
jgi:NADPH:quinone reductase-like Zn-dependent oxidoreductase